MSYAPLLPRHSNERGWPVAGDSLPLHHSRQATLLSLSSSKEPRTRGRTLAVQYVKIAYTLGCFPNNARNFEIDAFNQNFTARLSINIRWLLGRLKGTGL